MKKKRIFFLFSVNQRFFTDTSIELAKYNNFDIEISGIAYSRYNYFKKYNFKHLFYINEIKKNNTSDIYKKYNKNIKYRDYAHIQNVTLSELIHLDRHINRLEKTKQVRLAYNLFRFITNYIEIEKPDLVIAEGVDDLISFVACNLCKFKKIDFFSIQHARIGKGLLFSNLTDSGTAQLKLDYSNFYENIRKNNYKNEKYDEFIDNYTAENKQVFYIDKRLDFNFLKIKDFKKFLSYFSEYFFDTEGFHYKDNPFFIPLKRIGRIIKYIFYKSFIKKITMEKLTKLNYFYYGLHVYPEASTLIIGRKLPDQINLIKQISKALPENTFLILKEHPHSLGKRKMFFYNELNSIHNVYFVDEKASNKVLLKNCIGLLTISSSLSMECILLNKKLVIFGDYYFSVEKNTFSPNSFDELKNLLINFQNYAFDYDSRKAILYSILKNSIYLDDFLNSRIYTKKTISDFTKCIEKNYLSK